MSRIAPVDLPQIDSATMDTLNAVKKKLGMLPNIFTTFAHSPVALMSYMGFVEARSAGRLSNRQRELIAIAVAQENSCEYCLSAHSAIGKGTGLDDKAIAMARNGESDSLTDSKILSFALSLLRNTGAVSDEELEQMLRVCDHDHGLIIEIAANVVLNVFSNTLNRLAGTDVDFPLIELNNNA